MTDETSPALQELGKSEDKMYTGGSHTIPAPFPTGDVSTRISTQQLTFAELAGASLVVDTGVLEKDKDALIGVPHIITAATFWAPGIDKDTKLPQRGFVSLECVIGDLATVRTAIRRGWIPGVSELDEFMFDPEDRVIYNDGGTGIRRTMVQILTHLGRVEPGPVETEKDFDKPWPEWDAYDSWTFQNGNHEDDPKIQVPCFHGLNIRVMHGLRVSQYTKDKIPGTTYYLA